MARKRDETGMQARLMDAAMAAFSRKGLKDCTISDIAEAAGLARGTAYLYFKSKEQLMLSMYKLYYSRIIAIQNAMLGALMQPNLLARLREGCAEFEGWWSAHDISGSVAGRKSLNHPKKGRLRFEYASFQANDDPALKLVIYGPV